MLLNEKEGIIIGNFLKNLDKHEVEEMTLVWHERETITARFDTCFEDENEFKKTKQDMKSLLRLFLKLFVYLAIRLFL